MEHLGHFMFGYVHSGRLHGRSRIGRSSQTVEIQRWTKISGQAEGIDINEI